MERFPFLKMAHGPNDSYKIRGMQTPSLCKLMKKLFYSVKETSPSKKSYINFLEDQITVFQQILKKGSGN